MITLDRSSGAAARCRSRARHLPRCALERLATAQLLRAQHVLFELTVGARVVNGAFDEPEKVDVQLEDRVRRARVGQPPLGHARTELDNVVASDHRE